MGPRPETITPKGQIEEPDLLFLGPLGAFTPARIHGVFNKFYSDFAQTYPGLIIALLLIRREWHAKMKSWHYHLLGY